MHVTGEAEKKVQRGGTAKDNPDPTSLCEQTREPLFHQMPPHGESAAAIRTVKGEGSFNG
jgi:hypothetical protein